MVVVASIFERIPGARVNQHSTHILSLVTQHSISVNMIAVSCRVSACPALPVSSFIGPHYSAGLVSLSTIHQFFPGRQAKLTIGAVSPVFFSVFLWPRSCSPMK
jgi:hypothetical protein